MYCIGAVVPSTKSCGFAAPIFSEKKERAESSWYFVKCDCNNRIIEFVENENLYSIIYYLNDGEMKEYNTNDYSPVSFVYTCNGVNQVLVSDQNFIRQALKEIVNNTSVSVASRYKALKYIGKNNFSSNLVSSIYLDYYCYLRKNSQRFADDWKQKIFQTEGINLDELSSTVPSESLFSQKISLRRNIASVSRARDKNFSQRNRSFCLRARRKTFPQRRHRSWQSNSENQDENNLSSNA